MYETLRAECTNISSSSIEFFETSLLFFIFLGICIIFIYWILKLNEERRFRLKVQRDLKLSEEKYRTLFEISPILMNSFDKNGKILLWNKECEKVFGWSFEELKEFDKPLSLFYDDAKTRKDLLNKFTKSHVRRTCIGHRWRCVYRYHHATQR